MLENHADVLPGFPQFHRAHGRNVLAVHNHLAAGGFLQPVDAADQGAFAGPGQTDDAENFTFINRQVDIFQGVQVPGARVIDLVNVLQLYHKICPPPYNKKTSSLNMKRNAFGLIIFIFQAAPDGLSTVHKVMVAVTSSGQSLRYS